MQQIEWGLPASDFVLLGADRRQAARQDDSQFGRKLRLRRDSPWHANRSVGERLTWRGRNYFEAFAAINHCCLVRATILDLIPGQTCNSTVGPLPECEPLEHFHFVCRASAGSSMRVGHNVVVLRSGDLWRVHGSGRPAIVRGGCKGDMHLALMLARRHADPSADLNVNDEECWDDENKSEAAA